MSKNTSQSSKALEDHKTLPAHGTLPAHHSRASTSVALIILRAVDLAHLAALAIQFMLNAVTSDQGILGRFTAH
jgi:hypothetical protein